MPKNKEQLESSQSPQVELKEEGFAEENVLLFESEPVEQTETNKTEEEILATLSLEELEKKKLITEIVKLQVDKAKAEEEVTDFKRGFFRRTNAPTLISAIATVIGLGLASYAAWLGIQKLELQDLETKVKESQSKNNNLQDEKGNLEREKEDIKRDLLGLSNDTKILELLFNNSRDGYKADISGLNARKETLEKEIITSNIEKQKAIQAKEREIKNVTRQLMEVNRQLAAAYKQREIDQIEVERLKGERTSLESQIEPLKAEKAQLEQDVRMTRIEGQYTLLAAIVLDNLSDGSTSDSIIGKIRSNFNRDPVYKQDLENFLESRSQPPYRKSLALMLKYRLTHDQNSKNQFIEIANKYFAEPKPSYDYPDEEMISQVATAFRSGKEDINQFIFFLIKFIKRYDDNGKRYYIEIFENRLKNSRMDGYLDKNNLLDMVEILRADFKRGYKIGDKGSANEILIQINHVAYFSIAGKILAESENEGLRLMILNRMAVVGWLGTPEFGLPGLWDKRSWRNWSSRNQDIVNWWNEPELKTLREDDTIFQSAINPDILKK